MSLVFVVLVEGRVVYPSWGTPPPQFSGTWYRGCTTPCQIVREDVVIVDVCMEVFGSIALLSLHGRGSSL